MACVTACVFSLRRTPRKPKPLARVESSRVSPPHRPREDGLAQPADTSRSNLATPWVYFRGRFPNPTALAGMRWRDALVLNVVLLTHSIGAHAVGVERALHRLKALRGACAPGVRLLCGGVRLQPKRGCRCRLACRRCPLRTHPVQSASGAGKPVGVPSAANPRHLSSRGGGRRRGECVRLLSSTAQAVSE